MKKIIALAVAGAFVAPVMAADVTISGGVGYKLSETDGQETAATTAMDVVVTASEEIGNGMTVTAFVAIEGDEATPGRDSSEEGDFDSMITISAPWGQIDVGDDADAGFNTFDNKSDVAETGLDTVISTGVTTDTHAVQFLPALPVEGLSLAIGYAEGSAAGKSTTGYSIQYSLGGFTAAFGAADVENNATNASYTSVSYATGPFYVGIDNYEDQGSTSGDSHMAIGATYNYGSGKVYYESRSVDDASDPTLDTVIYGVSYTVGGGLNTYVQNQTAESGTSTITETDTFTVGVEYAF